MTRSHLKLTTCVAVRVAILLLLPLFVAPAVEAGFTRIDDFEAHLPGPIAGKGHWSATSHPTFEVAIDATDASNQVLSILDNETGFIVDAFNDDPALAIEDGATGTLFFRFSFDHSAPHVNLGLSASALLTPSFEDFAAQLRNLSGFLDVRDGPAFETGATLEQGVWYSVWVVIHNDTDQWELFIQGADQFSTQAQLITGADPIDFRNGSSSALRSFLIRSCATECLGLQHFGPWYLDDLYIDTNGQNLSTPAPEIRVGLRDLVQLPATSPSRPRARVNVVREPPDGSGRLFANDLEGPLYAIDNGSLHTYMDFRDEFPELKTQPGLASGFVSFAFDPEFATSGLLYTVHTELVGSKTANFGPAVPLLKENPIVQHSILTEWQASDPAANVFSGSSLELMRIASPHRFHNLGEIAFNPNAQPDDDDYRLLYIGSGDFGSIAIQEPEQLQRLDSVYGSMLRIDPMGEGFVRNEIVYPYGIPSSNPFANDGDPDTLGEIYAYGFRNAHRLSWDPEGDGDLFVTDIGELGFEEINLVLPGENYGWPLREGNQALDPLVPATTFSLPEGDADFGFRYPVAQYGRSRGRAIAGGFPYRGSVLPELKGKFVFGDIVTGAIFYSHIDAMKAADDGDPETLAPIFAVVVQQGRLDSVLAIISDALGGNTGRADVRFGENLAGELYVTTKVDGFIRIIPEPVNELLQLAAVLGLACLRRRASTSTSVPRAE